MPKTTDNKVKILQAAARVADQHGATHLTLERVAETAQLSKGGLLYHYPNKRALLQGMLAYLLEQTESRIEHHSRGQVGAQQSITSAMIRAESEQDQTERAMAQALLTAAAEDPELLDPARARMQHWFCEVGKENPDGLILLLATEGLRFLSMLDLLPTRQFSHERLYQLLLSASEGTTA
ncbi:MAG: TetR/AcrR family transcriptional regulator [Pseudomonadales bacterium]